MACKKLTDKIYAWQLWQKNGDNFSLFSPLPITEKLPES